MQAFKKLAIGVSTFLATMGMALAAPCGGVNPQYNWGEVQSAIWTLMGQSYTSELSYIEKHVDVVDADVQSLVDQALAQDGYRPTSAGRDCASAVDKATFVVA